VAGRANRRRGKARAAVSPIGTAAAQAARQRAAHSVDDQAEQRGLTPLAEIAAQVILQRTRLGLTQHDLARQVGTSHSAISRLEGGQHTTTLRTLQRLAAALDLDLHITLTPRLDHTPAPAPAHHSSPLVHPPRDPVSWLVDDEAPTRPHTATLALWLRVENNSKFVRGKTRVHEYIEEVLLRPYAMRKLRGWEYELTVRYADDADLDQQVEELLREMWREADLHHCFIEADVREEGTERSW